MKAERISQKPAPLFFFVLFRAGLERLELELAFFVLHQKLDLFFDFGEFLIAELDQADVFFEGGEGIL